MTLWENREEIAHSVEAATTESESEDSGSERSEATSDEGGGGQVENAEPPSVVCAFERDRLLRAMALGATMVERELGHHAGLRRCIWRFLDMPMVWQFEGDNGWIDCDASTQDALREALSSGANEVTLRVRSWAYKYDLVSRVQVNQSTHKMRRLRRRNPWDPETAPARRQRRDPLWPRWQFSTGFGWADCDHETQTLLREAEARGLTEVHREIRGFDYVLDLQANTQTNSLTGRTRRLQRLGPAGVQNVPAASHLPVSVQEGSGDTLGGGEACLDNEIPEI